MIEQKALQSDPTVIPAPGRQDVYAPGPNGQFLLPEEREEPPAPRSRGLLGRLSIAEWLLKHRDHLLREIGKGRELDVILMDLLLVAALPTALYGLVVGIATGSPVRMITNPFKLPVVLITTMFLCLPTLYIFSAFLGSRRTFFQTAALGFTGTAILGVVLAAFAPITWFLTFTAPGAYALHVLVNVAVLALGGFMGVGFLMHGTRTFHAGTQQLDRQLGFVRAWIVLYGLVGAQMGYLMRPFFSPTQEWFRSRVPGDETVFVAIWRLIGQVLGF